MANQKKNNNSDAMTMGVGAAAVAVVAAAAGAYFLYGSKDAKSNRKKVRSWMLKARGEVLEKMEKMKDDLTEDAYYKIVDAVVSKYGSVKDASSDEVNALGDELKSHWKNIQKHFTLGSTAKKPAKSKSKKAPATKKSGNK